MSPNPSRVVRNPWVYVLVFCAATVASAAFLIALMTDRAGDPVRLGLFGLVHACIVFAALFVSVGDWSESGNSQALRGLALTTLLGGCFGLMPPVTVGIALICSLLLGTQWLAG
ncbi:hypothetical protein JRI60_12155 [Archangium violaceum]|uniref:hypothetical protein n=1 Tax=Archangium violaceum TaxID=83451 RepID=UPI0019509255|nr:hypothetical protein [Archangium violaceum]QRN99721.1 hypothetical protein JRI60_12155 [Archangium violaceum]